MLSYIYIESERINFPKARRDKREIEGGDREKEITAGILPKTIFLKYRERFS